MYDVDMELLGNVNADATTGNQYLYDGEGRICAVKSEPVASTYTLTGYIYDADGTRVAKGSLSSFNCNFASNGFTPTTSYVLGLKGEQITELSVTGAAGNYVSAWKHANVFDGLGLQATYSLTGVAAAPTSTYFALNDWLGTKRAEVGYIAGSNGAPQPCVATFASLPYGDGLAASGNCPDATEHHFTGKERDAESGNDYFGARYYASSMGRFMSPDWSVKVEPVPYSKLGDPQTLNLYAYVGNNPLIIVDADGHDGMNHQFANMDCLDPQSCPASQDPVAAALQRYFRAAANFLPNRQPDGSYKATPSAIAEIHARNKKGRNGKMITTPDDPLGQCVTACHHFTGVPYPTSAWRPGRNATDLTDDDIGLAIATFEGSGSNARYTGDHRNSATFMGRGVSGIWVADQWPQGKPTSIWFMPTYDPNNPDNASMNAASYRVIIVPNP
jgi:RHS repeat-associated protein